jgi:ABC-2 type transport system ATP-binding protein
VSRIAIVPSSAATAAIETINLTKTYGHNRGIRDITMRIERGEIFGFLGPNGAGKSTTLRTILGFLRPTSGHAKILGLDSQRETVAIHRRIGNLPSEFSLEDRMTGNEMLRFFADLRGANCHLAYAHQLAERLDADLSRPMRRLSRGNKQKMGIIQALFSRPEVIVLDEPTSGLDPLVQEEFLTVLGEHRTVGATIFFSSHILSEVERLADRVGIIRDGELVAIEQPSTLTGRAFRYVRIQFAQPLGPAAIQTFAQVPGIQRFAVEDDNRRLTFQAHGGMDTIVKLASKYPVAMLDAERPPLEELFLTYYARDNHTATIADDAR